jgi:hypothetical protein
MGDGRWVGPRRCPYGCPVTFIAPSGARGRCPHVKGPPDAATTTEAESGRLIGQLRAIIGAKDRRLEELAANNAALLRRLNAPAASAPSEPPSAARPQGSEGSAQREPPTPTEGPRETGFRIGIVPPSFSATTEGAAELAACAQARAQLATSAADLAACAQARGELERRFLARVGDEQRRAEAGQAALVQRVEELQRMLAGATAERDACRLDLAESGRLARERAGRDDAARADASRADAARAEARASAEAARDALAQERARAAREAAEQARVLQAERAACAARAEAERKASEAKCREQRQEDFRELARTRDIYRQLRAGLDTEKAALEAEKRKQADDAQTAAQAAAQSTALAAQIEALRASEGEARGRLAALTAQLAEAQRTEGALVAQVAQLRAELGAQAAAPTPPAPNCDAFAEQLIALERANAVLQENCKENPALGEDVVARSFHAEIAGLAQQLTAQRAIVEARDRTLASCRDELAARDATIAELRVRADTAAYWEKEAKSCVQTRDREAKRRAEIAALQREPLGRAGQASDSGAAAASLLQIAQLQQELAEAKAERARLKEQNSRLSGAAEADLATERARWAEELNRREAQSAAECRTRLDAVAADRDAQVAALPSQADLDAALAKIKEYGAARDQARKRGADLDTEVGCLRNRLGPEGEGETFCRVDPKTGEILPLPAARSGGTLAGPWPWLVPGHASARGALPMRGERGVLARTASRVLCPSLRPRRAR